MAQLLFIGNPMTSPGDLIVGGPGGVPLRLGSVTTPRVLSGSGPASKTAGAQFDGSTGYVATTVTPGGNVPVTVVGFFLIPSAVVGEAPVWCCPPADASYCDFGQDLRGLGTMVLGGPNAQQNTSPSSYNDGAWHWFACVIQPNSGGYQNAYVDGVEVIAAGNPDTFNLSNGLQLARDTSDGHYGELSLARIAFWPGTALTAAQINAIYAQVANGAASYDPEILSLSPAGYWPLDEISGAVAADVSGHGNNGSYIGGVTLHVPGPITSGENVTAFQPSLATSPPAPTTVALVSGTAWQNAYGYDVILRVPVTYSPTGAAAATLEVGVGPTNTPTQALEESEPISFTTGVVHTTVVYVPAGWYALLTATNASLGTATVVPV
ncbi:MAG: hypothetical protein ACREN4_07280 [Candidatus Dormibacteria bacterium]